ncbi:hypothetical protein HBB16_05685 [Pseudonocardia sp. MCCB 268]|nr:hypothetical protein [Pseudonocardia cytotoxica]
MVSLTMSSLAGSSRVADGPMSKVRKLDARPQARGGNGRPAGGRSAAPGPSGDPDSPGWEAETVAGPGGPAAAAPPAPRAAGGRRARPIAEYAAGALPVGLSGRLTPVPIPGRAGPGEIDDRSIYRRPTPAGAAPATPRR